MKHLLLCVLANDAAPGDERRNVYTSVGPNFIQRLQDAVVWEDLHVNYRNSVIWMFGAGTDQAHQRGPTLADLGRDALKTILPRRVTRTNVREKNYYGTLEEIAWMVKTAEQELSPVETRFVFFTQWQHMPRVKLIWWLFYASKWGEATFVTTRHVRHVSLLHEAGGFWKAWRVYRGKEQPRYATPYPSTVDRFRAGY